MAVVGLGIEDPARARDIVRTARSFVGPDARLLLIHVHRLRQMAVLDYVYVEPPERVAKELDQETADLRAIAAEVAGPVDVDVVIGNPVEALLKATDGADLLVVGRSHLGLLSRILEGSVEARLAHEAPCPVLIIP